MSKRTYEYRRVRVAPNTWDQVAAAIRKDGGKNVRAAGGHIFGVWASQIGPSVNEGVVITDWASEVVAKDNGDALLDGVAHVGSSAVLLTPTSRPASNSPPPADGIYTHRWFEVLRENWETFLRLSEESWPQWEKVFGAKLYGFLRSIPDPNDLTYRVLLICRYRDLAHWNESRWWASDPNDAARESLELQRQRRRITLDTFVSIMRMSG